MNYQFNPEKFGYLPPKKMSKALRSIEHRKAFVKVICLSDNQDGSFWYSSCYRIAPSDDRWVFKSGLYDAVKYNQTSSHTEYVGCITSESYAKQLLVHLLGTTTNEGTLKYGKQRLLAPSQPVPRKKRIN